MSAIPSTTIDPKDFQALVWHLSDAAPTHNEFITNVLSSPDTIHHVVNAIELAAARANCEIIDIDISDGDTKGKILFLYVFGMLMNNTEVQDATAINKCISNFHFLTFFRDYYHLDEINVQNLCYHASGTTSIIFQVKTQTWGICALKVIQPQFLRLDSIRTATAEYVRSYGLNSKFSPIIHVSRESFILMEFIDGVNLNQYLSKVREKYTFLSDSYITYIAAVFNLITVAMSYFEKLKPSRVHGDLTPFNVLVLFDENSLEPKSIRIIDFGPNYVLQERVGSRQIFAESFSRIELFTAPEVLSGQTNPSVLTDIYSLGMIGLDMLCPEPMRKDMIGTRLREIWQNSASAGIAQIIEDLIEADPKQRMIMLGSLASNGVYDALNMTLQEHVRVYKEIISSSSNTIQVSEAAKSAWRPDVWKAAIRIQKILTTNDVPYNRVSKTTWVAAHINAACQALIVSSFVIYTALDLKEAYFPALEVPLSEILRKSIEMAPRNFKIGDFIDNLPGRLVALTFGLIAARYYANIYSGLEIPLNNSKTTKMTNVFMRFNSISYFIPIMVAIIYQPTLWPACAFIGTFITAINNALCSREARRSYKQTKGIFHSAKYHNHESERFLSAYREWWLLMGSYSLIIGVIGILLWQGIAKDEKIYAAFVCIINMGKIYRNNCGREAPQIYGNLLRLFFARDRALAKARQ